MDFRSENDLVGLLKDKSEYGFAYLYLNYSNALLRIVLDIVEDRHVAEDILQEVFVKIWLNFSQYDPERGTLFTWMARIAKNTAIDFIRAKKSFSKDFIGQEFEPGLPEPRKYSLNDAIDLHRLILQLPNAYHHLLITVYLRGYTFKEASEILQLPIGTIKTRVRRALKLLRLKFDTPDKLEN